MLYMKTITAALLQTSVLVLLASGENMQKNEPVILFLGDSLTAGFGIERQHAYPSLVEKKMQEQEYGGKVINAGISGDTTSGGLERLGWYLSRDIDILVIALGANDGLRGLPTELTQSNIRKMITVARDRQPGVNIVLAGMKLPPSLGEDYTRSFARIFPEIAEAENAALIPFLLDGVGGVRALNLPDGIHPNAAGQKVIFENVWPILEKILKKMK